MVSRAELPHSNLEILSERAFLDAYSIGKADFKRMVDVFGYSEVEDQEEILAFLQKVNAYKTILEQYLADKDAIDQEDPEFSEILKSYILEITRNTLYAELRQVCEVELQSIQLPPDKRREFVKAKATYTNSVAAPINFLIEHMPKGAAAAQTAAQEGAASNGPEIKFSEPPEHPEVATWLQSLNKDFDRLVYEYARRNEAEKLRQVMELFLRRGNFLLDGFLRSNGSPDDELIGLAKSFIVFTRQRSARHATEHGVFQNIEKILQQGGMTSAEADSWVRKLGSKAVEIYNIATFDKLGRIKAHPQSMASDWGQLKLEDVGDKDKDIPGNDDFSIESFDFMMDPDKRHADREVAPGKIEKGGTVYQNSRIMRTIMFLMPRMIKDFEQINGNWGEADGGKTREAFDVFLAQALDYLVLKFKLEFLKSEQPLNRVEIAKRTQQLTKIEQELTKGQPKGKELLNNWFTQAQLVSTDSGKEFAVTIKRNGEDFYSMGQDETITFAQEDMDRLLQDFDSESDPEITATNERQILWRTAGRMGTALGVRQHLFLNDLARGETPSAGIGIYSRWMNAVGYLSLMQYKSYKALVPNPFVSHFEVDWDYSQVGVAGSGVVGDPEKARTIFVSNFFTEIAIKKGGRLRKHKVKVGPINDVYDQIQTPFPTAYNLVVFSSRRRAEKPVGFESFYTGLEKFEAFIEKIKGVPGGTLDIDAIKKKDEEKLRTELIHALESVIQDIFSPLKASTDWFRWEHVAQLILVYIDKIHRVYRINNTNDRNVIRLTHLIRETLQTGSVNMGGVGSTKFVEIKKGPNKGKFKVYRGLVAQHLADQGKDLYRAHDRNGTVILTKEQKAAFVKKEQEYTQRDIQEDSKYEPLRGLGLDQSLLPKVNTGSDKNVLPDIRDYLLNLIPTTKSMGVLSARTYSANDAWLDREDATHIMRYRPDFGVAQILQTGTDALKAKRIELSNSEKMLATEGRLKKAVLGLPEEDKK